MHPLRGAQWVYTQMALIFLFYLRNLRSKMLVQEHRRLFPIESIVYRLPSTRKYFAGFYIRDVRAICVQISGVAHDAVNIYS